MVESGNDCEIFLLSFYPVRVWQEKEEHQVSVGINSKGRVSLVPGLCMLGLGKGLEDKGTSISVGDVALTC